MKNSDTLNVAPRGDREIVISRIFDAPRNLVFEAYTRPALLKRWLGVRAGWSLAVCEIDLRVGGSYRYVWRQEAGGQEMGVSGVFREVVPPERIVCTETWEQSWYPGDGLITTHLAEQGKRTTLTMTLLYESQEARDGVLRSPMQTGLGESYDQLEGLLGTL